MGGIFATYETKIHLEIIHCGIPVDIGVVDVSVPERDPGGTDYEQNIILGRSHLFKKYQITFNESDKTILFERVEPRRAYN